MYILSIYLLNMVVYWFSIAADAELNSGTEVLNP
jgi:hypothetical protein